MLTIGTEEAGVQALDDRMVEHPGGDAWRGTPP